MCILTINRIGPALFHLHNSEIHIHQTTTDKSWVKFRHQSKKGGISYDQANIFSLDVTITYLTVRVW